MVRVVDDNSFGNCLNNIKTSKLLETHSPKNSKKIKAKIPQ